MKIIKEGDVEAEDDFLKVAQIKGTSHAIKLSTFGAATSVADMRLKSHTLAIYSLNLMVLKGTSNNRCPKRY